MMRAFLCIYKYMVISKARHLHFGMWFIYNGHKFRKVSTTILLDEVICKYCHDIIFSVLHNTWPSQFSGRFNMLG